ncbi:hypothetical protein, partial [Neisseria weixii]|uniref:hypothetical protein n=1 Tax=Neisseria weixii TaxID=1853276 RepID=UPI0035A11CC0
SFPRRESILKFQKLILFNSLSCSKMDSRAGGNDVDSLCSGFSRSFAKVSAFSSNEEPVPTLSLNNLPLKLFSSNRNKTPAETQSFQTAYFYQL